MFTELELEELDHVFPLYRVTLRLLSGDELVTYMSEN